MPGHFIAGDDSKISVTAINVAYQSAAHSNYLRVTVTDSVHLSGSATVRLETDTLRSFSLHAKNIRVTTVTLPFEAKTFITSSTGDHIKHTQADGCVLVQACTKYR